jgi:hypothetical protein
VRKFGLSVEIVMSVGMAFPLGECLDGVVGDDSEDAAGGSRGTR